jgi:hypothetical protein
MKCSYYFGEYLSRGALNVKGQLPYYFRRGIDRPKHLFASDRNSTNLGFGEKVLMKTGNFWRLCHASQIHPKARHSY